MAPWTFRDMPDAMREIHEIVERIEAPVGGSQQRLNQFGERLDRMEATVRDCSLGVAIMCQRAICRWTQDLVRDMHYLFYLSTIHGLL